jgi:hypothetical protein
MYQRGRQFEKKGNIVEAYLLYSQAAAADPKNTKYWRLSQALRTKAPWRPTPCLRRPPRRRPPKRSRENDTGADLSPPTAKEIEESRKLQPPVELDASKERKDLDLRGDSKALFEQLARAYALDVVFDGDFPAGPVQHFRMEDAGYKEAFHALMAATGSSSCLSARASSWP